MDKAEEKAMEAYPVISNGPFTDILLKERNAYINGYIQAKKDLALTWEDVKKICSLSCVVEVALGRKVSDETHYAEVLRRFNEYKQKTK